MTKEKDPIIICYIHKIAMKKIEQEEPIPFLGIHKYVEYKCPMCMTTLREDQ